MAKGIKKAATISMAIMILLTGTIVTGCETYDKSFPLHEFGDFKYRIFNEGNDSEEKYIMLDGLTEEGQKKEVIIVPSEIDGYPVESLSCGLNVYIDRTEYDSGFLISENLKSIYVLSPKISITAFETFIDCPNLEKIVYIRVGAFKLYKIYHNQKEYIRFRSDSTLNENSTAKCGEATYYANVSYYYNFENEEDNFYWIDNFAYGEKITFIPEEPTREGYTFGGWYKEETCENKWDFGADTLPEAKYNENGDELYQETRLYAKWLET